MTYEDILIKKLGGGYSNEDEIIRDINNGSEMDHSSLYEMKLLIEELGFKTYSSYIWNTSYEQLIKDYSKVNNTEIDKE